MSPLYQVRADFLAGEIPELIKHPEDGLGLVVTDILLHLLNHPGEHLILSTNWIVRYLPFFLSWGEYLKLYS